ncbi:hypothetical protein GPALN_012334 [Globodera pallida]|nr:hypothetical protein GPALN_012334 [Globodera pallida]
MTYLTNFGKKQATIRLDLSQKSKYIEPDEEQFHERWQGKTAPKGIVKIEHEQHYGAVKVKGTVKIKHEPHYEDVKVKLEQNDESKKDFIKVKVEEVDPSVEEHGQRLTTASAKTKDGAQTSMAPKRQPPIVLDAHTSVRICHSEEEKLKIVNKFLEMKQNIYNKGPKYSDDEKLKIVKKLMQMKKHCGEGVKACKETDKEIAERFADLTRDGFKSSYPKQIDETVAKELGLNLITIYAWKRELGQTKPNKHSHSEQKELMKRYYEIKGQTPKLKDVDIVKILEIGKVTLYKWKKQFKRQQFHPNSVDGHSVEENATSNEKRVCIKKCPYANAHSLAHGSDATTKHCLLAWAHLKVPSMCHVLGFICNAEC